MKKLIFSFLVMTSLMLMVGLVLGYTDSFSVDIEGSDYNLEVTVAEDGDWMVWTFDFPVEQFTGDGNLNVGLIIATDGEGQGPAFQIHNNDGATALYPVGTWMYGSWDPTINDEWYGWPNHDLDVPIENFDWVSATGNRNVPHNGGVMEIRIKKSELGGSFHWAASPTVGSGFWDACDVTMQIPTAFGWSTPLVNMAIPNYVYAEIDTNGPEITNIDVDPDDPQPTDLVTICADIEDESEVDNVSLICSSLAHQFLEYNMVEGNPGRYCAGFLFTNAQDNEKMSCEITATDEYGNSNTETGIEFTWDGSDPTTTLEIGEPKYGSYITSDTEITLTCTDTISGCDKTYYSVDDAEFNEITAPYIFQLTGLADGSHSVEYYSIDNAGNPETAKSQEVILDNTNPEVALNELEEYHNSIPIILEFTYSDSGSGVSEYYRIMKHKVGLESEGVYSDITDSPTCETIINEDNSKTTTCEFNDGPKDGLFYFYIVVSDNLGQNKDSNIVTTVLDRHGPLAPSLLNPIDNSATNNVMPTLSWNEAQDDTNPEYVLDPTGASGVKDYHLIVDDDSDFSSPIVDIEVTDLSYGLVTSLEDGIYYWKVIATDNAENIGQESAAWSFEIDTKAPSSIINDIPNYIGNRLTYTITGTATDELSSGVQKVEVSTDNGNIWNDATGTTSWSFEWTLPQDEIYTILSRATDNAGNEEEPSEGITVNVDNTGPVTTVESPVQVLWFSTDFVVLFSDIDTGVESLGICYYEINDGGFVERENCNVPIIITVGEEAQDCSVEGEDTCKIEAYAVDSLGNVGDIVEVSYSIDWTWPTEIVSSLPSGKLTIGNPTLKIVTNKWATCRYDEQSKSYEDMAENSMTSADGINHEAGLTNLEDGMHVYYVRCQDDAGNKMRSSETIVFTIDTSGNYNLVLNLNSGWDFFFLPRIILETITSLEGDYSVQNVLSSIEGSYIGIMYHYDSETGWASYVPDRVTNTGWPLNDLTEFDDTTNSPYWIQMIQSDRLELV